MKNNTIHTHYINRLALFSHSLLFFKETTLACSLVVFSAVITPPSVAASADEFVKEQQQIWQDEIYQHRIDTLRQAQPNQKTTVTSSSTTQPINLPNPAIQEEMDAPNCLPVRRIELGDMPYLKSTVKSQLHKQAQQLSPEAINQDFSSQTACISTTKANKLVHSITEAYLDAGYFKITIVPKPTGNSTSFWQIHVATIQSIDNQTKLSTQRLFGNIVGKPANIAWLDQAVSNGERLIDGQLLLDIYPVGDDVRVEVSQRGDINTLTTGIEWRYDPNGNYGHNQIKLHATLRNILGQADLTSLTIQQSLTDKLTYDHDNQSQSASLQSIIPNGRWQWSVLVAADDSQNSIELPYSTLALTSESWQANLRGDVTLTRNQNSITTLYGQLAHQDVTNKILGSQLDTQSPTLTSTRFGISHTQLFNSYAADHSYLTSSGAWVLDLSVEKALNIHHNPATGAGLSDDYLRVLLSGYLTHQHALSATDKQAGYWQMTHELQGQYSDDDLFGISRQPLGSTYSGVRGIANAYNAASSGFTLRNTVSYEPSQSNWLTFGTHDIRWSPYLGVDYGIIRDSNSHNDNHTSNAFSGTIGLKLTGYDTYETSFDKRWYFDISASRAHVNYAYQQMHETLDTEISAVWHWQWTF